MKDLILLFISMSAFGVGVSSVDSNVFYPATVSYLNLELAKDLKKQGINVSFKKIKQESYACDEGHFVLDLKTDYCKDKNYQQLKASLLKEAEKCVINE